MTHLPRRIAPFPDPLKWHDDRFAVISTVDTKSSANTEIDASIVTFRMLLAHNSGLPGWLPLFNESSPERALEAALTCPFAYPPTTRVVYSDIGLIILGEALRRLEGAPLREVIKNRVTGLMGLSSVQYNPPNKTDCVPTEVCRYRKRRLQGEVHDENAWFLGGEAGHAGLFGNAEDVASFGAYFAFLTIPGGPCLAGLPLLPPELVQEMIREQAKDGTLRRGLGFHLRNEDPEHFTWPLSPKSYGHTGFTGTSLFVDPVWQLVICALTNRVYYGRDAAGITAFRKDLHAAVVNLTAK